MHSSADKGDKGAVRGVNTSDDDLVMIGRVIKPHGVRGEVVVDAATDDPDGRFAVGQVIQGRQTGKHMELEIIAMRPHQGRILVKFAEVPGRNEAESLRGMKFFAPPVFDEDEDAYYDHELIGLSVLDCGPVSEDEAYDRAYQGAQPEPVEIGSVTGVVRGPVHRLLEVKMDSGKEVLIPFVHAIVPIVDIDNEAIVITPPEGLLEI